MWRFVALLPGLCFAIGCASQSPPPPVVHVDPQAPATHDDKATALVASLTADVEEPRPIADAIVATGDDAAIRTGSENLVAIARSVDTVTWREVQRPSVLHTFDGAGVTPPVEMVNQDIENRVSLRLRSLFDAMTVLRSDAAKRYAFEIAARADADKWSRRAAVDALASLVDPKDAAEVALRAELAKQIKAIIDADLPMRPR